MLLGDWSGLGIRVICPDCQYALELYAEGLFNQLLSPPWVIYHADKCSGTWNRFGKGPLLHGRL